MELVYGLGHLLVHSLEPLGVDAGELWDRGYLVGIAVLVLKAHLGKVRQGVDMPIGHGAGGQCVRAHLQHGHEVGHGLLVDVVLKGYKEALGAAGHYLSVLELCRHKGVGHTARACVEHQVLLLGQGVAGNAVPLDSDALGLVHLLYNGLLTVVRGQLADPPRRS